MNRTLMVFIFPVLLLLFTSFSNQNNCKLKGVIIGFDATRCGCCGGWKIAIDDAVFLTDSIPNGIVEKGPDGCHIFPQKIYLEYEREKICNKRLKITCISRRD